MDDDRADALFARYVEHLVISGVRLDIPDLAGSDPGLAAALARRIEAFSRIDEALTRPGPPLSGRALGCYQVHERLGAGGMGEVYRADDMALRREVAIKVLPPLFALDAHRRARFEREARLLAAMRDPHIAAIHGIEHVEDVSFLVLELVPGETLAERIARGRLSLQEALPLFRGIAQGLRTAHASGIVHRDLKPANVKITPDGRAKVLDFSLGKAIGREELAVLRRSSASRLSRTLSGVILGTPSYMSPEQARGREVDERTDIWSFGCVLYEALAGRKAFDGETYSDVVASVLAGEPRWSALPAEVPASIRRLLRRCLEKEPEARPRDFGRVRRELDRPVATGRISSLALAAAVLTALAALVPAAAPTIALTSSRTAHLASPPRDPEAYRSYLREAFLQWRAGLGAERYRALEEASSSTYLTTQDPLTLTVIDMRAGRVKAVLPIPITPESDAVATLVPAPGGERLYMVERGTGAIFALDRAATALRRLPARGGLSGGNWLIRGAIAPDGRRLYVADLRGTVLIVDLDSRSPTYGALLPVPDGAAIRVGRRPRCVQISPDGKRAYVTNSGSHDVSVLDLDPTSPGLHTAVAVPDGSAIRVGQGPEGLAFSLDGRRLYVANNLSGSLVLIDADPSSPTYNTVRKQITGSAGSSLATAHSLQLSPDGTRLYVTLQGERRVAVLDTASNSIVLPAINLETATLTFLALTPDGRRAVVLAARQLVLIDTDPTSTTFHSVVARLPFAAETSVLAALPGGAGE